MSPRRLAWITAFATAACSNITATDEGVATLVLFVPVPAEVEVGQTIALRAAAVNADGDTLDVPIIWRALDTTITVDSVEGLLTGVIGEEVGYVIARVGTLFSDSVRFAVLPRVDTLVQVAPALLTVAAEEDSSAALAVRLDGGDPPVPVGGRRVVYQVIEPTFSDFDQRSVDLTGGLLTRSVATATSGTPGEPFPPIRIRRRTGLVAPDSAIVEVSAFRPGNGPIPGSGLRFVVRFASQ